MCPEHNHPPDQASNKRCIEKDKWISALFEWFKERQYSLSNFHFFPFMNPVIYTLRKSSSVGFSELCHGCTECCSYTAGFSIIWQVKICWYKKTLWQHWDLWFVRLVQQDQKHFNMIKTFWCLLLLSYKTKHYKNWVDLATSWSRGKLISWELIWWQLISWELISWHQVTVPGQSEESVKVWKARRGNYSLFITTTKRNNKQWNTCAYLARKVIVCYEETLPDI